MAGQNDIIIAAWNTVLFDKFCRFTHLLIDGLAAHSNEALARRRAPQGAHVLDVGCGFGDSTRLIAARVGAQGKAVGVDCAANFIETAEREARQAGAANASFFIADVQTDDLRGPYDGAFSRYGTMFFTMPGAAMHNIRVALKPKGTVHHDRLAPARERTRGFTMRSCGSRRSSRWSRMRIRIRCIAAPGPFSMAGPDMVSAMLRSAGYDRIGFERYDADICIGRDLREAVDVAMTLGPAGEIIRLAGEEGDKRKPEVVAALRETLAKYAQDDGVWAPSSTWFASPRAIP